MNKNLALIFATTVAFTGAALAADDHAVKGYVKRDGTYVAPTVATNPNSTKLDNYSTKDSVNPYSGKVGTVDPYKVELIKLKK